jgi:hypothetical protein
MKGLVYYVGEEWQLTSKSKLGKKSSTYLEVRDWSMPKVYKGVTEITLVNGKKYTLPGKRKGGQVYKALNTDKSKIKSIKFI